MTPPPDTATVGEICNIEAEQAVLGAVMVNNDAVAHLAFLRPDHFHDPIHAQLYERIAARVDAGEAATPITLRDWFAALPGAVDLKGGIYLLNLADVAATVFDVVSYARTVIDCHAHRSIVRACNGAVDACQAGHDPRDVASLLDASVIGLDFGRDKGRMRFSETMTAAAQQVLDAYHSDGRPVGIVSGIPALDDLTNGFRPGNLIVAAGRPGMGKSAFAAFLALRAARGAHPTEEGKRCGVIIVSLEMTDCEYAVRMTSAALGELGDRLPYSDAMTGFRGLAYAGREESTMREWLAASRDIERLPLSIADLPAHSPLPMVLSEIRRRAAMLDAEGAPVGMIVIDHLGLIRLPDTRENEASRVGYLTASFKGLAKRLGVPVLLLSQLNRGVENRDDKRPSLADLRNSGAIEQDADAVLFPFRPEYYIRKAEPSDAAERADWEASLSDWTNLCEVIVAKNRNGAEGLATVFCDIAINRFASLAR